MKTISLRYFAKYIIRVFRIFNERLHGLDFLSVARPRDLGLDESNVYRGSPSGNLFLRSVLQDFRIKNTDRILDVGCAKGDALRCMSFFPFDKLDGLEISDKLAAIAKRNFLRLGRTNVKIFNVDARHFNGFSEYDFFYFYNPFPASVMMDVMARISRETEHKEVILIYNNPTCHTDVEAAGFKKLRDYPNEWGGVIYVYSNKLTPVRLSHRNQLRIKITPKKN